MAPNKTKKGPATATQDGEEEEFCAVLFADAFDDKAFFPLNFSHPRCLLSLANTPLIEYTLNWLSLLPLSRIYICCNSPQVEAYLTNSSWLSRTSPLSVQIIKTSTVNASVGDYMRDLDQRQLIKSDFLAVYGDLVTNIQPERFETALAKHRARRSKNKNVAMTMLLSSVSVAQMDRMAHCRPFWVTDLETQRILHYDIIIPCKTASLRLPKSAVAEVDTERKSCLLDIGVDICSPEVPARYSDNFDWQDARQNFLREVLRDYDTNRLEIYHEEIKGFATRATTLRAYEAIAKDTLMRWATPFAPDANLLDQTYSLHGPTAVYKEQGVMLARKCNVGTRCAIGKDSSIGEGASVKNCFIERRCVIEKDVEIDGAIVLDDVTIGHGTVMGRAIVGSKAMIGKDCKIDDNVVIAHGAVVKSNTTLQKGTRMAQDGTITMLSPENHEFAFGRPAEFVRPTRKKQSKSKKSGQDQQKGCDKSAGDFHSEASFSIFDSMQKKESADTIQLELTALKLANGADDAQTQNAIASAFSRRVIAIVENGSLTSRQTDINSLFSDYQRLISGCVSLDKAQEQVDMLLAFQRCFVNQTDKAFVLVCNALVRRDLADADGVEAWWNDKQSCSSEGMIHVREQARPMVDFLLAEDSDEEEDRKDD
ncbi:hypothetical protein K470DRAFT_255469 [Piedraia hortae CBS 480.64]|uniref:Translation initiation factor eIF2B subunit epsilon n=1 Tax=Piedraia hortae CBS 480.64 TaxID=1314780 RepID=A0A6A7C6E7_9PEZI|nr:hypothetical protein K470DRAFT_255469 [Piedraia hortae CBS 480.64]